MIKPLALPLPAATASPPDLDAPVQQPTQRAGAQGLALAVAGVGALARLVPADVHMPWKFAYQPAAGSAP